MTTSVQTARRGRLPDLRRHRCETRNHAAHVFGAAAAPVRRCASRVASGSPSRAVPVTGAVRSSTTRAAHVQGVGATMQTRTVNVRVPSGIKDGATLRVAGKGAPGRSGGPAGDLLVTVHVTSHPVFGRKGEHLTLTVPITFRRSGARVDDHGADAGRRRGEPEDPGRNPVRTNVPRQRPWPCASRARRAISSSPSRWLCRSESTGRPARRSDEYAEATASDDPRADLIAQAGRE